jgi:hypothetical protein
MSKQSGEWKVTFFRRNGEPVDLWYTVNSYEDAKAFANRIQATDRELSAKIVRPTRIIRTPEGEMRSSYMMMLSNDMHLLLNRSY